MFYLFLILVYICFTVVYIKFLQSWSRPRQRHRLNIIGRRIPHVPLPSFAHKPGDASEADRTRVTFRSSILVNSEGLFLTCFLLLSFFFILRRNTKPISIVSLWQKYIYQNAWHPFVNACREALNRPVRLNFRLIELIRRFHICKYKQTCAQIENV